MTWLDSLLSVSQAKISVPTRLCSHVDLKILFQASVVVQSPAATGRSHLVSQLGPSTSGPPDSRPPSKSVRISVQTAPPHSWSLLATGAQSLLRGTRSGQAQQTIPLTNHWIWDVTMSAKSLQSNVCECIAERRCVHTRKWGEGHLKTTSVYCQHACKCHQFL